MGIAALVIIAPVVLVSVMRSRRGLQAAVKPSGI
jgi:hypothetical protein